MSMNIKDPEAHKLAQCLAEKTGETMTQAVTIALKEKLSRVLRAKATAEELRAIAKRFRNHLKGPVEDHGSFHPRCLRSFWMKKKWTSFRTVGRRRVPYVSCFFRRGLNHC